MSANPYAPPSAAVEDLSAAQASSNVETPWFAVSVIKLLVMSFCTLTLYQLYWLYQHWVQVKRRDDPSIVPAARAFFGVFFYYSLVSRIRTSEDKLTGAGRLAAGAVATAWIISSLCWRAPDPYWLLGMISLFLNLPVQAAANRVNAVVAPGHNPNSRFTLWNWLIVVPGGIFWILAMIGAFLP